MPRGFEIYPTTLTRVQDIPTEELFVIFQNESVHIPGDERSQTNPGHGYGPETRNYLSFRYYPSKEKWEEAIRKLEQDKTPYKAAIVRPAKVVAKFTVEVE